MRPSDDISRSRAGTRSGSSTSRSPGNLASELVELDTGLISDALESLGGPRVPLGIQPLSSSPRRIAGRAVTVELEPCTGSDSPVHLGTRAIEAARPGDVIVVANGGRLDVAAWGGLLSIAAAVRGIEAVVIDGACRDVDELDELDLEVFCRGVAPLTARGRIAERSFNEPVSIAGARVSPSDWIVGDASGLVVVPAEAARTVVATACRLAARETELRTAILTGEPVSRVLGVSYERLILEDCE